MKHIILLIFFGFLSGSCQTKSDTDSISGTYVREYSYKVLNPETGLEIGMRTIRDSIFIEEKGNGYRVSNHKWSQNAYDDLGWRNMEHAEDRPIPEFLSEYDYASQTFLSKNGIRLYYDPNQLQVYWTEGVYYQKLSE